MRNAILRNYLDRNKRNDFAFFFSTSLPAKVEGRAIEMPSSLENTDCGKYRFDLNIREFVSQS